MLLFLNSNNDLFGFYYLKPTILVFQVKKTNEPIVGWPPILNIMVDHYCITFGAGSGSSPFPFEMESVQFTDRIILKTIKVQKHAKSSRPLRANRVLIFYYISCWAYSYIYEHWNGTPIHIACGRCISNGKKWNVL